MSKASELLLLLETLGGEVSRPVAGWREPEATEVARLFNATGRSRRLRVDVMIAACALVSGAGLATSNQDDFQAFVPYGLALPLPP